MARSGGASSLETVSWAQETVSNDDAPPDRAIRRTAGSDGVEETGVQPIIVIDENHEIVIGTAAGFEVGKLDQHRIADGPEGARRDILHALAELAEIDREVRVPDGGEVDDDVLVETDPRKKLARFLDIEVGPIRARSPDNDVSRPHRGRKLDAVRTPGNTAYSGSASDLECRVRATRYYDTKP